MNHAFTMAAAFFCFAGYALYRAVESARMGDRRGFGLSLTALVPLAVIACAALWLGVRFPMANFWWNQGFGPGWECSNLGKGSAQVCARDIPPALAAPARADDSHASR